MVITKLFLSFIKEKKWLDAMNGQGYELTRRKGFAYAFEKTDVKVRYEYIFLKNGRRSYIDFDYKTRDGGAKAVYANGDMFVVKKPVDSGELTVFDGATDRRLNAAKKCTALNTAALVYLAAVLICVSLITALPPLKWVLVAVGVLFAVLSGQNYYLSYLIKSYIRSKS